jgi:6-pyruvoyl-tetrahydropterin synthase
MYIIDRYHDISTGHRVHNHESKCAHLHGHNYRVHFSVGAESLVADDLGELDSIGRVIDFSVVKAKLCMWLENNWDHKFLVWDRDPMFRALRQLDPDGVVPVPFNPTAENMAQYLVNVVGPKQLNGTGVQLLVVKIDETRKCSARYMRGE